MKTKHELLSNDVQEGALAKFGIGQPMPRIEDRRFITGQGRYVDDSGEAGLLHAAFLRSPHAHAEIRSIDTSVARSAPGVVAVYTGADWQSAGLSGLPLRPTIKQADGSPIASAPRQGLAIGRVRHVGECVGMIVAETARQALDALEAIDVQYAILDCVVDARQALEPRAPRIWSDNSSGNLGFPLAGRRCRENRTGSCQARRTS